MQRDLRKIATQFPKRAASALFLVGEEIMRVSKKRFVPVDLEALRTSGFVVPPKHGPGTLIVVALTFGGTAAAYAIVVHETPSPFDPPSWIGVDVQFTTGGSKYLEIPLMQAAPTLARDVGRLLKLDRWAG